MQKSRYCLAIAIISIISMSAFAKDVDVTINLEPDHAMFAGLSSPLATVVCHNDDNYGIAYELMENSLIEIASINKLLRKPDKDTEFIYTVIKPMNSAVIQNQNFDRVLV